MATRIAPISGFPEWNPAQRIVEQQVLDVLRETFELHGFASLETRAVETVEQLLRKGEIDKEVYGVRRLAADERDKTPDLALHFDLTVPFARYVLENAGKLVFPFRRYQMQKVWRGERPQEGRYREFTQVDIDVVDRDTLPSHYEVQVAVVMAEAFSKLQTLGIPPITIRVNHRKLAEGFYLGVGASDPAAVLRAVDKLEKVGAQAVTAELVAASLTEDAAGKCLELAAIRGSDFASIESAVRALGVTHEMLDDGLAQLGAVLQGVSAAGGSLVADLSIARGLDYYTGIVFESTMEGFENAGSVCSGGRYDSLASDGRTTYPGVGISFGLTRALGLLFARSGLTASRSVPSCVLVAVTDEDARAAAEDRARRLRGRGIACEVMPSADRFGKQIKFADRRGIPFVWFPGEDGDSVKDIRSGEQVDASADSWQPPAVDRKPQIRSL